MIKLYEIHSVSVSKTLSLIERNIDITFSITRDNDLTQLCELENKRLEDYTLTLSKHRSKSLNANSYLWALCTEIANKIGVTKEDVYRKAIREVGAYIEGVYHVEDIPELEKTWGASKVGWFIETWGDGTTFQTVRLYKGSSVYDGNQMRVLIDYVVDEAKDLGIETLTPNELEHLKSMWSEE